MSSNVATLDGSFIQEEPSQVGKINDDANRMPNGIPYIVGNELAERFSYYGMKGLLIVFMTQYLVDRSGVLATMSDADAKAWYHIFISIIAFCPIIGSIISDVFLGKYKTILYLSMVYALGHFCLAVDETRLGLALGLGFIAIGAGGIKPIVSAHVGDQFTEKKKHLLQKIFATFYFCINLGAFASSLLTPFLLNRYGPRVAFGVPGIIMLVAIVVFWLGRKRYITVPPSGWSKYKKELASPNGKKAMKNIAIIYLFVAMFWALFEQGGSSWVLQSKQMDRIMDLRFWIFQYDWLRFEILPAQLKALNPLLVLTLIPIFQKFLFPWVDRFFRLSPLRKMTVGMVMTALSFAIAAIIEERLQAGIVVGIGWYFWMELAMTIAEIFVSVTGLEFSYTQAPNSMKSIIMGMWFLTITVGNTFTAGINFLIEFLRKSGTNILQGGDYYWFFVISMLINTVIFAFVAYHYKEENYIQTHGAVKA